MRTPLNHPDIVRDAISRCAITKADLSQRSGINRSNLRDIDKPDWNPKWETLSALCDAVRAIKRERA